MTFENVQSCQNNRHGRKHEINPTNVNYRANIWALKQEGCNCIIVGCAVGSLQKNILPGDVVILDQFIDRFGLLNIDCQKLFKGNLIVLLL